MTIRPNLKTGVALLALGGLGLGLVGAGVRAAMTDTGTVTESVKIGALTCALSSTDPAAIVSADGHTVTINLPEILSSASGNAYSGFTLSNTGTIPMLVHWTVAASGTIAFQPTGRMGYTVGSVNNVLTTDLTLQPGAHHDYDSVGFQWAPLLMDDLGKTASVTYTAHCGEVPPPPPPPVSHVQFIGANSATGHAALALPAGSQPGDLAVVLSVGSSTNRGQTAPSGFTSVYSTAAYYSSLSYRVLVAGDTTVPATTSGADREVAVYRGATGLGAFTFQGSNITNNVGGAAYPLYCNGLTSMTKADGSSWVGCMGGDGYATTNANQMVFDSNTTNRSASLPDIHLGLADTNGGVAAWTQVGWPGDNFPMPGTHTTAVYSFELLSA